MKNCQQTVNSSVLVLCLMVWVLVTSISLRDYIIYIAHPSVDTRGSKLSTLLQIKSHLFFLLTHYIWVVAFPNDLPVNNPYRSLNTEGYPRFMLICLQVFKFPMDMEKFIEVMNRLGCLQVLNNLRVLTIYIQGIRIDICSG